MKTPLFVKYTTESGSRYIYDAQSGEILRVNQAVYSIIDDYGILTTEELFEKHSELGREEVQNALSEIDEAQQTGLLVGHEPEISIRANQFFFQNELIDSETLLRDRPSQLILGVTEECNLRCDYCVYDDFYDEHRAHGHMFMPFETAKQAIDEYLPRAGHKPDISFYGGEPLLAFDLIQRCVTYGNEKATRLGRRIDWSMTTNGTLLTPKKSAFIVENDFIINFSLDGPKELHDRYRVQKNANRKGERVGSFDVVHRNLRRFVTDYPDYKRRGIIMVVAPPYDFERCADFIGEFVPHFPNVRCQFVNVPFSLGGKPQRPIQSCGSSCSSGCGTCGTSDEAETHVTYDLSETAPADIRKILEANAQFLDGAAEDGAFEWGARPENRFVHSLVGQKYLEIHNRPVSPRGERMQFNNAHCYPGHVRLFCSASGKYYPCEKTVNTEGLELGDVDRGFSSQRAEALLNDTFRFIADCGNCINRLTCSNCFVKLRGGESRGVDPDEFGAACEKDRRGLRFSLASYTSLMERNVNAFPNVGKMMAESSKGVPPIMVFDKLQEGAQLGDEKIYATNRNQ